MVNFIARKLYLISFSHKIPSRPSPLEARRMFYMCNPNQGDWHNLGEHVHIEEKDVRVLHLNLAVLNGRIWIFTTRPGLASESLSPVRYQAIL